MLKSLLGYQSGMGGGATETVIRKKVYESAINNTLKNNFPLVLKVHIADEKTYLPLQNLYLPRWNEVINTLSEIVCLLSLSWWRSWWESGSHSRRINTPLCVPTCWVWPWSLSPSLLWASAIKTILRSFPSARTTTRWDNATYLKEEIHSHSGVKGFLAEKNHSCALDSGPFICTWGC